jgi:hypothetical protein
MDKDEDRKVTAMAARVEAAVKAAKDAMVVEAELHGREGGDNKEMIGVVMIASAELFSDMLTATLRHPEPGRTQLVNLLLDIIAGKADDGPVRDCIINKIGVMAKIAGRLNEDRGDGMAEVRL